MIERVGCIETKLLELYKFSLLVNLLIAKQYDSYINQILKKWLKQGK